MKKRMLSTLLVLCMVLALLPVTVWAASDFDIDEGALLEYATSGDTIRFDMYDFSYLSEMQTGHTIDYIRFLSLPSTTAGYLYYGTSHISSTESSYFKDNINRLSFQKSSSFSSSVDIPFEGHSAGGDIFIGVITIRDHPSNGETDTPNPSGGDNTSINSLDAEFSKMNTYISGQFSDIPDGQWYTKGVQTAYEYGLMSGVSDTSFNPEGNLTFAEAIAIASRLHSLSVGNNASFTVASPWYQPYVDYAFKNNIISAQYDYNSPISRADFALFISNSLSDQSLEFINNITEVDIPDVSPAAPLDIAIAVLRNSDVLAVEDAFSVFSLKMVFDAQMGESNTVKDTDNAIYRLYRAGIVAGNDEYGTYTPNENITRGAVAVIISRVVEPTQRLKISLTPKPASLVPLEQLSNLSSIQKGASKSQLAQAYEEARQIVEPLANLSKEAQLSGIALALRVRNEKFVTYSMSAPHYNDPYGFFITGDASCAGCTRATGLCLNMLGIPYEHVNEDQFGHQWTRVNVDGTYWICDAYGLYCGPEKEPYKHPYIT